MLLGDFSFTLGFANDCTRYTHNMSVDTFILSFALNENSTYSWDYTIRITSSCFDRVFSTTLRDRALHYILVIDFSRWNSSTKASVISEGRARVTRLPLRMEASPAWASTFNTHLFWVARQICLCSLLGSTFLLSTDNSIKLVHSWMTIVIIICFLFGFLDLR